MTVATGVKSSVPLLLIQPGYAADTKILGGQPYIGLAWGPGNNRTSVDLTLSQPAVERTRTDSITGGTDLYGFGSISDRWSRSAAHLVQGTATTNASEFECKQSPNVQGSQPRYPQLLSD